MFRSSRTACFSEEESASDSVSGQTGDHPYDSVAPRRFKKSREHVRCPVLVPGLETTSPDSHGSKEHSDDPLGVVDCDHHHCVSGTWRQVHGHKRAGRAGHSGPADTACRCRGCGPAGERRDDEAPDAVCHCASCGRPASAAAAAAVRSAVQLDRHAVDRQAGHLLRDTGVVGGLGVRLQGLLCGPEPEIDNPIERRPVGADAGLPEGRHGHFTFGAALLRVVPEREGQSPGEAASGSGG